MNFLKARVLLWPILSIIALVIGAIIVAASFGALNLRALYGTASEEHNSQVVRSIERKEEIVLVQLGVEGIADKRTHSRIGDFDIPWTGRAVYLRYTFDAKLGIDGDAVTIEPTGDDTWRVSIPAFIFIGADNVRGEIAAETADGLAWTTPEIDDHEMRDSILNDEAKALYIENNQELLRDQAEIFYSNIIHAVDPDAVLKFVFSDQPATAKK